MHGFTVLHYMCDLRAFSWVTSKIIVEYKIVKELVKQIMQVGIPIVGVEFMYVSSLSRSL